MRRRAFLGAGAVGVAGIAGVGVLGGPVDLEADEPVLTDDGTTKVIEYHHDGDYRASLALDQAAPQATPTDAFDLRYRVHHFPAGHEDSVAQWYRVDVRAPPSGGVLFNPGSLTDWPVSMERLGDGWTRISAELGPERGDANVDLPLRIDPMGDPLEAVTVRTEMEIADGGVLGGTYRIEDRVRFEPVVE